MEANKTTATTALLLSRFMSLLSRPDQDEANEPERDVAVTVPQRENDRVVIHQSPMRHEERPPKPIH